MGNVVINGLTAVHAGSGGTLTTVDVCKTPNKCRPNTYTNMAVSSDSAKTAGSVIVNGNPACNQMSIFAQSTGDEPGSCGGVSSGTIKGIAEFITFSPNVFIEGLPAVRQTDLMVSNNRNTPPAPLQQPGASQPPSLSPQGVDQLDKSETPYEIEFDVSGVEMDLLNGMIEISDAEIKESDDGE